MLSPASTSDLITLAQWMAGDFSNQQQALTHPTQYAHIHIFFRPLPFEFFSGIGFYSEQVYDYDLWSPYRQGVHRLVAQDQQIYIENYGLKDPIMYAGAARELSILATIRQEAIERRYGCSMVFQRHGEKFRGCVEGDQCLIERQGGPTYLVSDVVMTATTWESLDRGIDIHTHEQVWGSTHGPLCFEKQQNFAHELPLDQWAMVEN